MHRTRFGRLLSLACVPSSRRTSSTPAELRLLPTQRPVRDGQYGYERGLRKSPETRNYARSGKRRSAPRRELPKPPDRPPRAENETTERLPFRPLCTRTVASKGFCTPVELQPTSAGARCKAEATGHPPRCASARSRKKSLGAGKALTGSARRTSVRYWERPGVVSERLKERDWKSRGRG
jgi:hypothetical protein